MNSLLEDIVVFIGMPRAGTTWLYENLKLHPEACASEYKEINRYVQDMSDDEYLSFFAGRHGKVKLDISPGYYFDKQALANIAANHAKAIIIVREPSQWIVSLQQQIGKYDPAVGDMIQSQKYLFKINANKNIMFDYATYNQTEHLAEIGRMFGPKLLWLDFADLQSDPVAILRRIEEFLGLSAYFSEQTYIAQKINAGDKKISRLYAFALRTNLLEKLLPIVVKIVPRAIIDYLRGRMVYGK